MSLFEQILQTNLINFIIVISTLVLIFKKAKLGALIDKMADDIKNSVEKSSTNAQNAINDYKNTKKATKDTPLLQEEILKNANINAQNIKEKIETKTKLAKEQIKENIEKVHNSQKERYKNLTVSEVYCACVKLAKDEIIKRLDNEMHNRIINSSIDELDKIEGSLF